MNYLSSHKLILFLFLAIFVSCQDGPKDVIDLSEKQDLYEQIFNLDIEERICVCWYKEGKPDFMGKDMFESFLKKSTLEKDALILSYLSNLQYSFISVDGSSIWDQSVLLYDFGVDQIDDSLKTFYELTDTIYENTKGDLLLFETLKRNCTSYHSAERNNIQLFFNKERILSEERREIIHSIGFSLFPKFITYAHTLSADKNPLLLKDVDKEVTKIICTDESTGWSCQHEWDHLPANYTNYKHLIETYLDTSQQVQLFQVDSIEVPLVHW